MTEDKTTEAEILEALIHQKILNVMSSVKYMPKDGNVKLKTGGYKYLSAEEIVKNIRAEMIKQGLIIWPVSCRTDEVGQTQKDITMTYRILAVEDGSFINVQVTGGGHDSMDKKSYKAMTGAYKYALRQTFMIETGKDDPDKTPSSKGRDTSEEKDPLVGDNHTDNTEGSTPKDKLVTQAQLKKMMTMVGVAGIDADKFDVKIKKDLKIESKNQMTMEQIDPIFDYLDKRIADKKAQESV